MTPTHIQRLQRNKDIMVVELTNTRQTVCLNINMDVLNSLLCIEKLNNDSQLISNNMHLATELLVKIHPSTYQ